MDRDARRLPHGIKAGDNSIVILTPLGHDLAVIIAGDATHIIVNRRTDRQRLACQVDTCENLAAFGNAGQALCQHFGINMIEVEVDMVLIRANATAFADFHCHRARHHVTRGKVLCRRGIAFHKTLPFGIGQIAALAPRAFGNQHASAVNTRWVELNKFKVLQRKASAQHHAPAIARAGVRRCGGEIGTAIAARCQNDGLRAEAMDAAIFHAHGNDATAGAVFHDEVKREIFDVEIRIVLQRLLVERMEHRVAGPVRRGAGALHWRASAHILHMAAERTLINRPIVIAAERHARVLKLIHRRRRFTHHIFNGVLVAQPV